MKLVIFGLTVSSSWGNGHATLWRGLLGALARQGHSPTFFERDVHYYAAHRDLDALPGTDLHLYGDWPSVRHIAHDALADADVAIVTSYCPDALAAEALVRDSDVSLRVFYDLDAPITLAHIAHGEAVPYLGPEGLREYDLALSYAGGPSLDALRGTLGARAVAPLYGSADPEAHRPALAVPDMSGDLSYLGTYAEDRQPAVERLFLAPARRLSDRRFLLGGSMYPSELQLPPNVRHFEHVPPDIHPAFYCSSLLTLNVTRAAMLATGWCPSGRLFEAAACGVPVLTDAWAGLDRFFTPGEEILVAHGGGDVERALARPSAELHAIGAAARQRVIGEHTAEHRARELVDILHAHRRSEVATVSTRR